MQIDAIRAPCLAPYPEFAFQANSDLFPRKERGEVGKNAVGDPRCFAYTNPRRHLTAQPFQAVQRVGAGFRDFDAFGDKMLAEEVEMHGAFVELLRRQHRGEYRHLGAQLHIHQRLDHGVGDELMAVVAAIDHETRRHDRGVAPGLGQKLRVQGDLERAGHREQIDLGARSTAPPRSRQGTRSRHAPRPPRGASTPARRRPAAVLRNADGCLRRRTSSGSVGDSALLEFREVRLGDGVQFLAASDSWFSSFRTRIRAHGTAGTRAQGRGLPQPFSFIRTLTVGFGFTPNLLTLPQGKRTICASPGRRSRAWAFSPLPPVGTFTPP